jgi:hypothetical protein
MLGVLSRFGIATLLAADDLGVEAKRLAKRIEKAIAKGSKR